jgi:hypothetical protein
MKDITTTSFGLIIAYLLPGFVGLYSLTFWFNSIKEVARTFYAAQSDLGLALVLLGAALVIGLQINALRFLLFERLLCRTLRIDPANFSRLMEAPRLTAFTTVIEENFRYHQFFGGITLLIPPLYAGLLKYYNPMLMSDYQLHLITACFTVLAVTLNFLLYEIRSTAAGLKEFLCSYALAKRFITWLGLKKARRLLRSINIITSAAYVIWLYIYLRATTGRGSIMLLTLGFIALELITGIAAITALRRYVERTNFILKGA